MYHTGDTDGERAGMKNSVPGTRYPPKFNAFKTLVRPQRKTAYYVPGINITGTFTKATAKRLTRTVRRPLLGPDRLGWGCPRGRRCRAAFA